MKKSLLFAIPLLASCALVPASAQIQVLPPGTLITPPKAEKPAAQWTDKEIKALGESIAFPYGRLEKVLRAYVDNEGNVFYAKVKGDNDLEIFVRAVALADLSNFPVWTIPADPKVKDSKPTLDKTAETVFWINTYNGLMLKAIADAYPVNSVTEIKGLDTEKTREVGGKKYSFKQLRDKIAELDPRGLFALNSGMRGGPTVLPLAMRYSSYGRDITAIIQSYINNETNASPPNRLQNTTDVSPFLASVDEYFKKDNKREKFGGVRYLLATYTTRDADRRYFVTTPYRLNFKQGDDHINEQLSR